MVARFRTPSAAAGRSPAGVFVCCRRRLRLRFFLPPPSIADRSATYALPRGQGSAGLAKWPADGQTDTTNQEEPPEVNYSEQRWAERRKLSKER